MSNPNIKALCTAVMAYAPQFAIASDPKLAIWLEAALFAAGGTILLIVATFIFRLLGNLRRAIQRRARDAWRPLFTKALAGGPVGVRKVRQYDARPAMMLYAQLALNVKGSARQQLAAFARRCGMEYWALMYLHHSRMPDRLLATAILGHLGGAVGISQLRALTRDSDPVLSIAAARALLRIDAPSASGTVVELARIRSDWPVQRVVSLLRDTQDAAVWDALVIALETSSAEDLPRFLEFAAALPQDKAWQAARRALNATSDPAVIVKSLRLLSEPRDAARVRPLLSHADWIVRLAAVKALGRMGSDEDLPRLTAALSDSVWWVRQRAADALTDLPFMNRADLERLLHDISDRYAADALGRAMAERR